MTLTNAYTTIVALRVRLEAIGELTEEQRHEIAEQVGLLQRLANTYETLACLVNDEATRLIQRVPLFSRSELQQTHARGALDGEIAVMHGERVALEHRRLRPRPHWLAPAAAAAKPATLIVGVLRQTPLVG